MLRLLVTLPLLLLLVILAWMLLGPTDIQPLAWTPDPSRADLQVPNQRLAGMHRVELGQADHGPEDVAIGIAGTAYVGLEDGRILAVNVDTGASRLVASTGGRPLGLDLDHQGRLVIADAGRGLLRMDIRTGEMDTLTSAADSVPFGIADDVEVAGDGRLYFTDASAVYPLGEYRTDILEGAGSGRLLVYDPVAQTTTMLMDGLMFANGVAVSQDSSFVLVVETGRYRVWRYWLSGERAGQREIFVDGLPGFPDGISRGSDERFWLTLAAPRDPTLDALAPLPFVRKMLARLPPQLFPGPQRWSYVIGLDSAGNIVENLQQPDGVPLAYITSAQEHDGALYLGSLHETAFGIYPLQ